MAGLLDSRSAYADELQNPGLLSRLYGMTRAEVGGQGPDAQQAFLETIFNRAASRKQSLGQTLSGSYFPQVTYDRAARGVDQPTRARYEELLSKVLGGSNVSNYATGNASGTVGFNGGPQTAAFGGERFGVEGPDKAWAQALGYAGPVAGATPSERPTTTSNSPMASGFFNAPNSNSGILGSLLGGISPSAGNYLSSRRNAIIGALAGLQPGANSLQAGTSGALQGMQLDQAMADKAATQRALSGLGGGPIDFSKAAQALIGAGNTEGALQMLRLAETQKNRTEDVNFREKEFKFRQDEAARATKGIPEQVEERKKVAEQIGLKPDDPAYKPFVSTGKFPREDQAPLSATDKKAIMEADDAVLSAKNVIDQLGEAKKISPFANTGLAASARATAGNILPDKLLPDVISSKESSEATKNYENLVLGQALSQLKSIFGGNPTEGERKVLLQLQASLELPDKQRQVILDRAMGLAQRRMELNQTRSNELRGGTFYKTGGGTQPAGIAAPSQSQPETAGGRVVRYERGPDGKLRRIEQ